MRKAGRKVACQERALAAARAERGAAIRAALAAQDAPTHAQIAEAAGLKRGQISAYGPAGDAREAG